MTNDALSAATPLSVDSPEVQRMLQEAACDIESVRQYDEICCQRNWVQPASLELAEAVTQPMQTSKPEQESQPQICSRVEGPCGELPLSSVCTVLSVPPPALFHCRLSAFGMSPNIPCLARQMCCDSCHFVMRNGEGECSKCNGATKERWVVQLRLGDRTGMLDAIVCNPPAIVCCDSPQTFKTANTVHATTTRSYRTRFWT